MPSVTVNMTNFREGAKVTVPNLGVFENGSTTDITEKQLKRFIRSSPTAKNVVTGDKVLISNKSMEPAPKPKSKVELELEPELEPEPENVDKEENDG